MVAITGALTPADGTDQCSPLRPDGAGLTASVSVRVDVDGARKVFKLVDALEDSDDVQNVYTNVDVSDEVLAPSTRSEASQG
jgi:hypothetical protein